MTLGVFQIMHRSTQVSLPLDPALIRGKTVREIIDSGVVNDWKAGTIMAIGSDGYLKVAADMADYPLGFLVTDALQGFHENIPSIASGLLPVAVFDHIEVVTDRVVTLASTINPGTLLTVKNGLVSATLGDYDAIGIALEAATVSKPVIHGLFFHSGWPTA
jgi:hypothetical protein